MRPIGIGESLHRFIGKVVCFLSRDDAEAACGASQLCAALKSGTEGVVHVARGDHQDIQTFTGNISIIVEQSRNR